MKEKYDAIMAEDKPKEPVATASAPEVASAAEEATAAPVAEANNTEEVTTIVAETSSTEASKEHTN
jgi:hypothetical protein